MQNQTIKEQEESLLQFASVHNASIHYEHNNTFRPYCFIHAHTHDNQIIAYLYSNGSAGEKELLNLDELPMKFIKQIFIKSWETNEWKKFDVIEHNDHHKEFSLRFKIKGLTKPEMLSTLFCRSEYHRLITGLEAKSQGGAHRLRLNDSNKLKNTY